jgi:hypothetical protein
MTGSTLRYSHLLSPFHGGRFLLMPYFGFLTLFFESKNQAFFDTFLGFSIKLFIIILFYIKAYCILFI